MTPFELHKYSEDKFRRVIKYAYNHSRFYNNFYKKNGISYEDLDDINFKDIPIMTKDLVRENFYNIATCKIEESNIDSALKSKELLAKASKYYLVHTSGSTGVPCNFLYDSHAITTIQANFIRLSVGGHNKIAYKDFPINSVYIAPVGNGYACTAIVMSGMDKYHARGIVLDAKEPLSEWKSKLKSYNPSYLSGYPSCLNLICELQKEGKIDFKPKKIITGGEPVNKEAADYYADCFHSDVIDFYGCTESILIGAGSNYYKGLYLFDDLNYLEVDKNKNLIITPLYNKVFPLIRYRLGDLVEGFTKEGYKDKPYSHIDRILGRSEELMWFKNINGEMDFLHPLFIDDLNVKGVLEYQFQQIDHENFILRYVKIKEINVEKEIKKQIDEFLIKKHLENVKYKLISVSEIKKNPYTGKTKLVIKM